MFIFGFHLNCVSKSCNHKSLRAGYSPTPFLKPSGCIKLGVPCVLYMLCAQGPRHTVTITEKSSITNRAMKRLVFLVEHGPKVWNSVIRLCIF